MQEIWNQEKNNRNKAIRLLGTVPIEKVDVDVLEKILKEIFGDTPDCLSTEKAPDKSNIRKLIIIYDLIKYKK